PPSHHPFPTRRSSDLTSRTNPRKIRAERLPPNLSPERAASLQSGDGVYDLTPVVLENIERLGLDYLVAIGGDDTLSFARVLSERDRKSTRLNSSHGSI